MRFAPLTDRERTILLGVAVLVASLAHSGGLFVVSFLESESSDRRDLVGRASWIVPALFALLFLGLAVRTRTLRARLPLLLAFAAGWLALAAISAPIFPASEGSAHLLLAIGLGAVIACLGAGLGLPRRIES